MAAEEWRYFATRLNGDGTEDVIAQDIPLADPTVELTLSGATTIAGTISPEIPQLQATDGAPLLIPWQTAIYAERNGQIEGGAIVQPGTQAQGAQLQLDCAGFSHYPQDMPYDDEIYFVEVDALDIYRHIWDHLQGQPGGNLGVIVDSTKAGVLVGEELEEVEFETGSGDMVAFEAGPFKLAWWMTDNLGQRLTDLSELAQFEYREQHRWVDDGQRLEHRIRLGVPRLGRRRDDLHFQSGENLTLPPTFVTTDYASEVWALGAGEGRMMKIGRASRSGEKRLRRVAVVADKELKSKRRAEQLAGQQLGKRTGETVPSEITIRRGEQPLPDLGDEIQLQTDSYGWHGRHDPWVRVVGMTLRPDRSNVTCRVEWAD